MMNAILMALVGLIETAVKYSVGLLLLLLLFAGMLVAYRSLAHPSRGGYLSRSRA